MVDILWVERGRTLMWVWGDMSCDDIGWASHLSLFFSFHLSFLMFSFVTCKWGNKMPALPASQGCKKIR